MTKVRAYLLVSGLVQGVYFRTSMQKVAAAANIVGWVRNLPDGRVEAMLEGDDRDVRHVIEWSRRGPPHAEVEDVSIEWGEPAGQFERFAVR